LKELAIHYLAANHLASEEGARPRVRVAYKSQPAAQPQERTIDFNFVLSDRQRSDIQWYLEEYLIYPWGEWTTRAHKIEAEMEKLGVELFEAVFADPKTAALYAHVADHLGDTRIVIHADDPEGVSLPCELMRDPARGEYGASSCGSSAPSSAASLI
jgi:hypothetical protein